jgi:hypothetical protein
VSASTAARPRLSTDLRKTRICGKARHDWVCAAEMVRKRRGKGSGNKRLFRNSAKPADVETLAITAFQLNPQIRKQIGENGHARIT